jgi:hypothetical protein
MNTESDLEIRNSSTRGGWMLRGLLVANPSLAQCLLSLRMSYQSFNWVKAGVALATETDELLLMRWHSRLPSPGSMTEQMESFQRGLGIWRAAFNSACQHDGRVSAQLDLMRASSEHRMRQQILQNGERVGHSSRATT